MSKRKSMSISEFGMRDLIQQQLSRTAGLIPYRLRYSFTSSSRFDPHRDAELDIINKDGYSTNLIQAASRSQD